MSRKGNCLDNSQWKTFLVKQEMYHGEALCSFEELKSKIERYIDYYNKKVEAIVIEMKDFFYRNKIVNTQRRDVMLVKKP
ncbi:MULTISPECIES: IS3 family transposase [Bacillaceae]|uniref:Integrase catalytic domain-containing protein n=1 Tax=Heyndrickxia camelliae TaxID=1707093 RepID=A0A2N3LMB4_9BACI|nr:hypothetical protein CWO92_05155 [Heyndrickxia camelliae]